MICGPSEATVHEKHFWYRAQRVTASISEEQGLDAGAALQVPFANLVSSTLLDSSSFELRVRMAEPGQDGAEGVRCFIFRLSDARQLSEWTKRLSVALLPSLLFTMLSADIWRMITPYLDMGAWRSMRLTCSRANELVRGETPRMRPEVGTRWVHPVSNPWGAVLMTREIDGEDGRGAPHPLFPGLKCFERHLGFSLQQFPLVQANCGRGQDEPLSKPYLHPSLEAGAAGVFIEANVEKLYVHDAFKLTVKCGVEHLEASWAIIPEQDYKDLLGKPDAKSVMVVRDKEVSFTQTGEFLVDRCFSGFVSAVVVPGRYKVVFFWRPMQSVDFKCIDVRSAISLVVEAPPQWENIRLLKRTHDELLVFEVDPENVLVQNLILTAVQDKSYCYSSLCIIESETEVRLRCDSFRLQQPESFALCTDVLRGGVYMLKEFPLPPRGFDINAPPAEVAVAVATAAAPTD